MSQLNVDTIKNRLGTSGPIVPSLSATNDATVGGGTQGPTAGTGGSGIVIITYPT